MTLLRRLVTRVRIYFARRRIWRALAAEQERRDSLHWIMACNACGIREVAVGRGQCATCLGEPNYGAMADLNLANWWKRRKQ